MAGRVPTSAAERFAEKCKPVESGCVEWIGGTTKPAPHGYGVFHVGPGKRMVTAHRWAYEQAFGPVTSDTDVCHRCDNRLCVNLAHLFAGTRKENMEDAVRKGRTSRVARNVGNKHPMHVLTEKDVVQIRAWKSAGWPMRELSNSFGVSFAQISRIVNHQAWKHV